MVYTYFNTSLFKMKRWLWVDEVELRRYLILFQNHDGFDHACYTTGGLQVSNIGFDAALMQMNVNYLSGKVVMLRKVKGGIERAGF